MKIDINLEEADLLSELLQNELFKYKIYSVEAARILSLQTRIDLARFSQK